MQFAKRVKYCTKIQNVSCEKGRKTKKLKKLLLASATFDNFFRYIE